MLKDWRNRLRKLHELVTGPSRKAAPSNQTFARQSPLAINLGIDFGTSFTKVCFRDLGTEETGIVTFDNGALDSALVPSIVSLDGSGALSVGIPRDQSKSAVTIRYLKMRLAGFTNNDEPHAVGAIDLTSDAAANSLAAWYLATIISRARGWVLKHEAARVKGREMQWSANVGVPVEHYDSPAIEVFRKVLAVAWTWASGNNIPLRLEEALSKYEETRRRVVLGHVDCHAIPEIAAAVQSFITSRGASPGVYVYFDIGGGTVDGVVFDYISQNGTRSLDFYSAKVESLGAAVIANDHDPKNPEPFEKALATNQLSYGDKQRLAEWSKKLQRLVAYVIMTAKQKDSRDWLRDAFQDRSRIRKTLASLDPSKMLPLIIFVGGGGAGSRWYQDSILSTYADFGHRNAGIPPYALTEVPTPRDLDMAGLDSGDFRRFAIAYGLSVPYGEGPEIRLPSQFPKAEPIQRRRMKNIVDYYDIRDTYY